MEAEKRKAGRPKAGPREDTHSLQARITEEEHAKLKKIVRGNYRNTSHWLRTIIGNMSLKPGSFSITFKGVVHQITKEEAKELYDQVTKILIK